MSDLSQLAEAAGIIIGSTVGAGLAASRAVGARMSKALESQLAKHLEHLRTELRVLVGEAVAEKTQGLTQRLAHAEGALETVLALLNLRRTPSPSTTPPETPNGQ